jgi:hypothetical protein
MSNKIGSGYAAALRPTGVELVWGGGWRNFGLGSAAPVGSISSPRSAIGRGSRIEAGERGMAEICDFSVGQAGVVARLASHGEREGSRNQGLGLGCRLMAGLTARSVAQLPAQRLSASPGRGLPPFRPAPAATMVASASRQIHEIRAKEGPYCCLKLRSRPLVSGQNNGSGFGPERPTPDHGVRGAGRLPARWDAQNRSASRGNGAEVLRCDGLEHGARAPFVERSRGGYGAGSKAVNPMVETSVDKSRR